MPAFVPAWKKLGLQLKNAPPVAEESVTPTLISTPHVTKKRKANDGDDNETISKPTVEAQSTPQKRAKITFQDDSASITGPTIPKTPASAQQTKQKTPKSILKKTKKAATNTAPEGTPADAQAESDVEVPPQPPKTKAEKKAKRAARLASQSNADSTSETAEVGERPHLVYLRTYHETPGNWKFKKAHQIQLLKDVFNLYRIPPSYNDALSSYIKGLQGAAARERLGVLARSIVSQEKEDGNGQGDKQAEKRIRARLIVAALESGDAKETLAPSVPARAATAEAEPKKKKSRGRKRRVEVESESSSSSESSDSSDSDDEA